ncbi:MAG: hypothetical protein K2U26_03640 [Cyclobacteriaceae bacterium]|nr:hypothetical protein [Cyclobacteriaceae bacterium]
MILKIAIALFVILLFALIWVLFTPVKLYLDTDTGQYEVRQKGTFHALAFYANRFNLRLKILGIQINTEPGKRAPKAKPRQAKTKKGSQKSIRAWMTFGRQVANAFSLKQLQLDIDTDDVALNAELVPLFYFAQYKDLHLTINFIGRLYARLEVEVRLYKILWAYVKLLTTTN